MREAAAHGPFDADQNGSPCNETVSVKSACPAVASSTLQAEQWFACPVSKHINIVYISATFLLFPSVLYLFLVVLRWQLVVVWSWYLPTSHTLLEYAVMVSRTSEVFSQGVPHVADKKDLSAPLATEPQAPSR